MRWIFFIFILIFSFPAPAQIESMPDAQRAVPITDEAQRLYEKYGDAVYQVQVIDLATGKKTSIGSGFQFNESGMIATNYHVIAEALQRPQDNRLEYLHDKGAHGEVKILMADVVHDLAIVQMDKPGKVFVHLGSSVLPKGKKVFSLGNPHDIGFTIIEGTYNGYSKESFIDKILFSGSLNPGMSGGPALTNDGSVIGINVSTAGNQISFLIPVEPLKDLLDAYQTKGAGAVFSAREIEEQLLALQEKTVSALLEKKWESVPLGGVMVPGRVHDAFKCWGSAAHRDNDLFKYFRSTCFSQDEIFLDDDYSTGSYAFRYAALSAKKDLNLLRFYNFYQNQYGRFISDSQAQNERDVTNFECHDRFIHLAGGRWKASFCARQYKKYPQLYDAHLYMARTGYRKDGMIVSMIAEGVSKKNALALTDRFLHEITAENKGAIEKQ